MSNYQPIFTLARQAERVRFGPGSIQNLWEEAGRLGCRRLFLVTTEGGRRFSAPVRAALTPLLAGRFHRALPHAPIDITGQAVAEARMAEADLVLSVGGGTAIGLGKVLADRLEVPHITVPTTYSGIEAKPFLETSTGGIVHRQPGADALPACVIYDPDLTLSLPWEDTLGTAMAALAHAVGGVYARDRSPLSRILAKEALWALAGALPILKDEPGDTGARGEMLYAAWAASTAQGAVARSVQHRLVEALCGPRGVPEARLHGVLLPHTVAFAEGATGGLLDPVRSVFGAPAGQGISDFAQGLGVAASLELLGVGEADLDRVADLAAAEPPRSERPATRAAMRALLGAAWAGAQPRPHPERPATAQP